MRAALSRSGIDITPNTVKDLVRFLASGASTSPMGAPSDLPAVSGGQQNVVDDVMYITFQEFRDFLIMLPRKATPYEIYKCESLASTNTSVILLIRSGSLSSSETILGWEGSR
jgi:solute carrier family 25 phosphate transporter 23/24/25/41